MLDNTPLYLILILVSLAVAIFAFDYGMKKLLKVEREKWPSYNHVNRLHKRIDWTIRIAFTVLLMIFFFIEVNSSAKMAFWPFEPWTIFLVFLVLSESVRAYMEWKYADNPRTYILTLSVMIFILMAFLLLVWTNFFGLG